MGQIIGTPITDFQKTLDEVFQYTPKSPVVEQARGEYLNQDSNRQIDQELNKASQHIQGLAQDYSPYLGGVALEGTESPSFTGKNYNVDELYSTLSTGEVVKNFDTYTPGIDNMEAFAKSQSNWDKWTNGTAKALSQFSSGVVGGTVGTIYGIGAAIGEGSFAALYDNDFQNTLDNWNEKLKYELPNYRTKEEQDMSFGEKLGTANFWADDVMSGLSFTASALATEAIWSAATGGVSLATKGARIGLGLGRAARVGEEAALALNSVDDIVRGASKMKTSFVKPMADATRNSLLGLKGAIRGGAIGEGVNLTRSTLTGAGYEAGFEARTYMREMRANFEQDWTAKHGTPPSEEDKAAFESNLKSSANGLFAYNLAIVGASNFATYGSLVGLKLPSVGGNATKWINKNIFGSGIKTLEGGIAEAVKATKLQKIGQHAYSLGKGMITEGVFEEGMQAVGQNTAKSLMQNSYDQKFANASYDITKAFGNALHKTYGTEEGLEEVYTGMLIGGLTGNALGLATQKSLNHEFKDVNTRHENIAKAFGENSKYSTKVAVENMLMSNRVIASQKATENAEKRGDLLGGQLSRNTTIWAQLTRAHNLDYFDQTVDSTKKEIDLVEEESLMKEHGLTKDQAVELKKNMQEEYQTQADSFKEAMDFSKYFVGNKVTKQERDEIANHLVKNKNLSLEEAQKEAKGITTDMLSQAMAYELYMGKVAHGFSGEMLGAFQNEVQNIMGSTRIQSAFKISDVLNKSSKATKAKLAVNNKALKQATNEFQVIENKYREVENIMAKASTPEERQSIVGQLSDLQLKQEEAQKNIDRLEAEGNVLYNSAKLEDPLSKDKSEEFISREEMLNIEDTIKTVFDKIEQYKTTNPVQAERLDKLLREYNKSILAFQKYSQRTQQIMTEGIGLRGKRNILTEMLQDKTPTQATIGMIQGLMDTHYEKDDAEKYELQKIGIEAKAKQEGGIPAVMMDYTNVNPNQAEIDRLTEERKNVEENSPEAKAIDAKLKQLNKDWSEISNKNFIVNQIKKHPYMFSQVGEDYKQALPTEEEIDEYYDLVEKDIIEGVPMSPEEIERLKDLNTKMANWQLLESLSNEGVSIADLIKQDVISTRDIQKVKEEELDVKDVDTIITNGSDAAAQRPMSVLQTVQNVFAQKFQNFSYISHMTPKMYLTSLGQGDVEVEYYKTKKDKDGNDIIDGKVEKINAQDINTVAEPNMVITFGNSKIQLTEGMKIKVSNKDFNFRTRNTNSGYQMVFGDAGKPIKSDFDNIDTYSPQEIYRLKKGNILVLKIDMNDPYNQKLSPDEYEANLKIDIYDPSGSAKVGTMKAVHSTDTADDKFRDIRAKAVQLVQAGAEVEVGTIEVEHIFMGSPNLELDAQGKEVQFPIVPEQIETYGVWENGKIRTKETVVKPNVDLLKGINKTIPIVILKEGDMSIAYPVSLVKTDSMKGDAIVKENENTPAQIAIQLNEALLKDGKKPMSLYYYSSENTNMFDEEGNQTEELKKAIDAVNKIQSKVDYKSEWFKPTHDKADLVGQAEINIDLQKGSNKFLSPKIATDLNSFQESIQPGVMTDEEATQIATNLNKLRKAEGKYAIKVLSSEDIKIGKDMNILDIPKGSYKYIVSPLTGDVLFIRNKELFDRLRNLNEADLQVEIPTLSKRNLGKVFTKTKSEMDTFNKVVSKILEVEGNMKNTPKVLNAYKRMFGTFTKLQDVKPLKVC